MKIENGFIISPHKEIKMYISSIDSSLILLIYNSLTKYKYRKMDVSPLNRVWLSEIRLRYLDKVETNEIRIKLLSPLLLRKHDRDTNKDIYVTCEDKMFEQEFNDNIERLCAEFGYSFSKITITSISSRKVITKIMKNSFDATLGTFVLKTENLELLNILYKIGIGSRRSEGFGMFEVLIDV
jgi:CRISPR-associated endoribonuclease Cas6